MPEPIIAKVIEVHVNVETPCPRCDGAARQPGIAVVLPDGRIGEVVYICDAERLCKACQDERRDWEKQKNREERQRDAWARGKPTKTRLRGSNA